VTYPKIAETSPANLQIFWCGKFHLFNFRTYCNLVWTECTIL